VQDSNIYTMSLDSGAVPHLIARDLARQSWSPDGRLIAAVRNGVHLELQRFVAAGFTPLAALQTATLNPAKFYGREGDFGSVKAGRIADLVLLSANPLDDIRNTRTIAGVIADGRYVSTMAIDSIRERVRQVAARN
jgi:adenine deaminase